VAARRAKATEWDEIFSTCTSLPWESAPFDDLRALLERKDVGGEWALDIGCGSGMHLELLTSSFEHVVGIDIAKRALLRAEKTCAACGLLMADAPRLPLAERVRSTS